MNFANNYKRQTSTTKHIDKQQQRQAENYTSEGNLGIGPKHKKTHDSDSRACGMNTTYRIMMLIHTINK